MRKYGALALVFTIFACKSPVIFQDTFDKPLSEKDWIIETQEGGEVYTQNGKLIINSKPGISVWLNRKLNNNFTLTYQRRIEVEEGENDRLSDFNQFWMADAYPFDKNGIFETYDSTRLYYLGVGGNYNSTTRFRKYFGNGQKPVITEYLDTAHLLKPNHTYSVKTMVRKGRTRVYIDGEKWIDYTDPNPLKEGYFGFRTTWSRQSINHVVIKKNRSLFFN